MIAFVSVTTIMSSACSIATSRFCSSFEASDVGALIGQAGQDSYNFGALFQDFNNTSRMNGFIAAFLVYDRALTDNEVNQVQGYLASRYNI